MKSEGKDITLEAHDTKFIQSESGVCKFINTRTKVDKWVIVRSN